MTLNGVILGFAVVDKKQCQYSKCSNLFIPNRTWQKFCSRECGDRFRLEKYWQKKILDSLEKSRDEVKE